MCVIKNNNKNACNKWQNWWGSWLYLTLFYVISEKVLAGMCGAAIYNIMSDTNAFSIHWEKWGRKFYRSRLKRQEHKLVANVCCVWMRINRKYLTRGVTAILITSHTKHYNLYYTYIRGLVHSVKGIQIFLKKSSRSYTYNTISYTWHAIYKCIAIYYKAQNWLFFGEKKS